MRKTLHPKEHRLKEALIKLIAFGTLAGSHSLALGLVNKCWRVGRTLCGAYNHLKHV